MKREHTFNMCTRARVIEARSSSRSNVEKCIRIAAKKQVPRFLWANFSRVWRSANLFENKFSSGFEKGKSMERRASNEPGERSCYLSTIDTCLPPYFFFFFAFDFVILFRHRNNKIDRAVVTRWSILEIIFHSFLKYYFYFHASIFSMERFSRIGWIYLFFFYNNL